MAKGQTYKVAFWAQDNDCKAYTVSDDMNVTVNYANDENKVNNDETRDAFFKTVEFTVTGSTSIDVELKRPFAQINVGVTKEDWDAAVASGITIAQSSVVIKNAATSLNLLDGTVSGETEVSYSLANIPSDPAILKVDTDGDGVKEEYNWLSMSYILPADATTGYAKTTLENIAFVFAPANSSYSNIEFNQGLNSVPVQRNWRTNILGKLLTGDITFNIVIDEEFEDDHNVVLPYATIGDVRYNSFADAMAAVQDGETIKLEGETTLDGVADGYLFTIDGKKVTIDLNGYGFVANVPDVTKNSAIFRVAKNSGLTIVGEGNVKVTTNKAPDVLAAFINNDGGTVNLKGGNWTMTALEYPDALIPTFVDNNSNVNSATLNIYDGTYTFHRNLFRNFANAAGHNNFATVATINIYGGTFNGRESDAGAIWNQKPSSTVPAGAGVINVMGGTFNNVEISNDFTTDENFVTVTTAEELANAITEAASADKDVTIFLGNDITGNITAAQKADGEIAIIGQGHKFAGVITIDGKSATPTTAGFTISDVNFVAESISADACIRLGDGTSATRYTCNVTISGCTFDVLNAVGIKSYTGGDKNLTITNCTATARAHSLAQLKGIDGVLVKDCDVKSVRGINVNNSTNVLIDNSIIDVQKYAVRYGESSGGAGAAEVYSIKNSTLKSANVDDDATIVLRGTADNSILTIENTTIEGTKKIDNSATNAIVIIDGAVSVTVPENNTEDVVLSNGSINVTVPETVAQTGETYKIEVKDESTTTNTTTGETTVAFDLTMYKNDVEVSGTTVYAITKNIGTGLFISEVTHNGTALTKADTGADQTYTYDSATGVLTIYTASFSPFAVTYADYKDYEIKLNIAHNKNSTISVSTGKDLLPIVAVNPEIYGYSVYDGDTRITDKVIFRFSDVKKETISENSYKVSFTLAVKDANGDDLTIKEGRMNPYIQTDPREYLKVYVNLLEVPAGYSVSEVKVDNSSLVKTTRTDWPNTGEYMILSDGISFQSKTAGLIEVTLTK